MENRTRFDATPKTKFLYLGKAWIPLLRLGCDKIASRYRRLKARVFPPQSWYQLHPQEREPYYRIVITGVAPIAPTGVGREAFWEAHLRGHSGIREWVPNLGDRNITEHSRWWPGRRAAFVAGLIPEDFDVFEYLISTGVTSEEQRSNYDIIQALALAATYMALYDAGLPLDLLAQHYPPKRRALIIGNTIGPLQSTLRFHRMFHDGEDLPVQAALTVMPNSQAGEVADRFSIEHDAKVISSASDVGLVAIADGVEMLLKDKDCDVVIAGGAEAVLDREDPLNWEILRRGGVLSHWEGRPEEASRVATKDRSGLVPADGAGMVILERLSNVIRQGREHQILAELSGGSVQKASSFRGRPLSPEPGGVTGSRAIREALERAHVSDYETGGSIVLYPHLTGTSVGDRAEATVINSAFKGFNREVVVTSGVPNHGHSFAVTGVWNIILAALTASTGAIPRIINLTSDNQDPRVNLNFALETRVGVDVAAVVVHDYGFYNKHATLVLKPFPIS